MNTTPFTTRARLLGFILWPILLAVNIVVLAPILILASLFEKVGEFLDDVGSSLYVLFSRLQRDWMILARPGLWEQAENAVREASAATERCKLLHGDHA